MTDLPVAVTVTDAAGLKTSATSAITVTTASGYADGAANAPGVAPTQPGLLTKYKVRPPWKVAGVDYGLGPRPGTVFKLPAANSDQSMVGVPNASFYNNEVHVKGNGCTISGFDLRGISELRIHQGTSGTVTITDCLFTHTVITDVSVGCNLVVRYCVFDNKGIPSDYGYAMVRAFALQTTVEYCIIKDPPQGIFTLANATIRFNLIQGISWQNNHPNAIYVAGTKNPAATTITTFNTLWSEATRNSSGFPIGLGDALAYFADGGNFYNSEVGNNVFLAVLPGSASYCTGFFVGTTESATGGSVHDNYFDLSGATGAFYPGSPGVIQATYANNFNMITGAVIPHP